MSRRSSEQCNLSCPPMYGIRITQAIYVNKLAVLSSLIQKKLVCIYDVWLYPYTHVYSIRTALNMVIYICRYKGCT